MRQRLLTAGAILLSLALVVLGGWFAFRAPPASRTAGPVPTAGPKATSTSQPTAPPALSPTFTGAPVLAPARTPAAPAAGGPAAPLSLPIPAEVLLVTVGLVVIGAVLTTVGLVRQATRRGVLAERKRIQQALHDGLQPRVAAMRLQLETLEDHPELAPQLLGRLTEQARALAQEVRAVGRSTEPATGELDKEFEEAAKLLRAAGISVLRKVVGRPWPIPDTTAHELGLVIRESLANVLKHAGKAATVLLFLYFAPDQLEIEIADTGAGFDSLVTRSGTGLRGMTERVSRLKGRLEVHSEVGQGTTIRIVVPRRGREAR